MARAGAGESRAGATARPNVEETVAEATAATAARWRTFAVGSTFRRRFEPEPAMNRLPPTALARVLAPLDERAFFDDHWERGPVHVERAETDRFADLVSTRAIETLLSTRELRFPDVQLARSGAEGGPIAIDAYTDPSRRILPLRLIGHHRDGATIVLSHAHRELAPLGDLVRALGVELGWRCQTNLYLSPPGERGFASHYDTHDVFVLQVEGRKTFRFFGGGVELPFCDETYDPESTGERVLESEIELGAGDTLYIPRGVVHDAVAHPDTASLHVTLGLFPIVLRDVLIESVRIAAERDVELRRAPSPWREPDGGLGAPRESLRAALADALDEELLSEALASLRDDVAIGAAPDVRGLIDGAPSADELELDTVLEVRRAALPRLERRGSAPTLRTPGEVLGLGEANGEAVERLLETGRARVGELALPDDERRLALARRLIEHGIVEIAPSG